MYDTEEPEGPQLLIVWALILSILACVGICGFALGKVAAQAQPFCVCVP